MNKKDFMSSNDSEYSLKETRISSEQVYDGKLLQVYVDEVTLPDGSTSTRDWIKHPGACAVVPVFNDGTIMLLKQFRYPPRKVFIEVPAGKIDPGESALNTAKRELTEESGIECSNIVHTGLFYPAIGYADEVIHIYAAWGLKQKKKKSDEDEFLINHRVSFSRALKMIETGEITDGKTICSLTKTASWWRINEPFSVNLQI